MGCWGDLLFIILDAGEIEIHNQAAMKFSRVTSGASGSRAENRYWNCFPGEDVHLCNVVTWCNSFPCRKVEDYSREGKSWYF